METNTINTAAPVPRLVQPSFVERMEAELQANQHKGDWRRWYPTPLQVLAEIQHHQGKLMLALSAGDCEKVKEYSADIANFAMKVDEQFGGPDLVKLLEQRKPTPTHFHDCTGTNNGIGKITAPQRIG